MPNRLIRNTAILAINEATYSVDAGPTGAANALAVSNLSINPINAKWVARDLIRPYLGASEELQGESYVEMGFDIELVGSGSAGTATAWSPVLQSAGFAETLTAAVRADYTPISVGMKSCTLYWYDDGVLHKARGARSAATLKAGMGTIPKMGFKFIGLYSTPTAASLPTIDISAFKQPQVVRDGNSQPLFFGGTHALATAPLLAGGTSYPSQGLELDFGLSNQFTALLGGESVDITDRQMSGKVTLDLAAAQEVSFAAAVQAGTLSSLGLQHGTVVGNKVLIWAPSVQMKNPQKVEVNGKRLVGYDLRVLPVTGNDELRIVTSF
ncbi:phage tail tube protein [Rhodoferax sp.]|uniref:phage tail tube protein n=1 Tax=Rhodoferax sp. TaxID=50421 RepID=UPI00374D526B